MQTQDVFRAVGTLLDGVGVAVIAVGALIATVRIGHLWLIQRQRSGTFQRYRQSLGRAVLLGLEFLVAGDIVRTVAVSPTFGSLGGLAIIVAIRTFLSMSLRLSWKAVGPGRRDAPRKLTYGHHRTAGARCRRIARWRGHHIGAPSDHTGPRQRPTYFGPINLGLFKVSTRLWSHGHRPT